jgi:Uncharacterized alpha/beta hydrolase domain (DUF2235)
MAGKVTRDLGYLSVIVALLIYLKNYLKIAPSLPGYGFFRRLMTLHLTRPKHQFYDTTLNVNVGYATHAISIDENRADFARVGWRPTAEKLMKRDEDKNLYFEQVWFPGVHADIGGGYLENEARLSDVALSWTLRFVHHPRWPETRQQRPEAMARSQRPAARRTGRGLAEEGPPAVAGRR